MISLIMYVSMHVQVCQSSVNVPFGKLVHCLEHLDPAYVGASPLASFVWLHSNQLGNLNQYQLEQSENVMQDFAASPSGHRSQSPSLGLVRMFFPDKQRPIEPERNPDQYVTHLTPKALASIVRFLSFQILPSATVDTIQRRVSSILKDQVLFHGPVFQLDKFMKLLAEAVIEARKPGFPLGYRFPSQVLMAYLLTKIETVKDLETFVAAIPELAGKAHHPWQKAFFIETEVADDFLGQRLSWLEALENGPRHPLVAMKALAAIPTFGVEEDQIALDLDTTDSHDHQAHQATRQMLQWLMGLDPLERLQVVNLWNISEAQGGNVIPGLWRFYESYPTVEAQSGKEASLAWYQLFAPNAPKGPSGIGTSRLEGKGKPGALQLYSILERALSGRVFRECKQLTLEEDLSLDLSPHFEMLLSAPGMTMKVRKMKHGYLFEKGQGATSEVACLLFGEDSGPRFSVSETPDNLSAGGLDKLLEMLELLKPDLASNEAFTDSLIALFSFFKDSRVVTLLVDALQLEERSKEWVARSLLALDLTETATRQMAVRVIFEQELDVLYPMAVHFLESLAEEHFLQPYLLLLSVWRLDTDTLRGLLLRAFACGKALDQGQFEMVLEELCKRGMESRVFWLLGQEEKPSLGNIKDWSR